MFTTHPFGRCFVQTRDRAATLESSRTLLAVSPWRNFWGHKGCPSLSPALSFPAFLRVSLPPVSADLAPLATRTRAGVKAEMGNCQSFYNATVGRCCRCVGECCMSQPRPPATPVPVVPAASETPEAPVTPSGEAEELPEPEMWRMRLPRPPSVSSGKSH